MKRILAILIFVVFVACNSDDPARRIEKLEQQLFATEQAVDPVLADELVTAYCDYAIKCPNDEKTPEILFKAVNVSMNIDNAQRTIAIIDKMIKDYPDYPRTQAALFVKGFIFETYYENFDMARQIYEQYLALYPDGEFAEACRASIANLGLTPEELVKKFENQ